MNQFATNVQNYIKCACGAPLFATIPKIYGPDLCKYTYCNQCSKQLTATEIIYHCMELNVDSHQLGYDLCETCCELLLHTKIQQIFTQYEANDMTDFGKSCSNGTQCVAVVRLMTLLQKYDVLHKYTNNIEIDTMVTSKVLNDFFHSLYQHSSDQEFDGIHNLLSSCDVTKCSIFSNRNNNNYSNAIHAIMSKIHCYYLHSYDIGNRLRVTDMDECKSYDQTITSSKVIAIKNMLRSCISTNGMKKRINKKYYQIPQMPSESSTGKLYHIGYSFKYNYPNELSGHKKINPKYSNLK
eukprot:355266_1